MNVRPSPVVRASNQLYLLRLTTERPSWYGFHGVSPITRSSHTILVAFDDETHAHCWAGSLEAYERAHGMYPTREFSRPLEKLDWMLDTQPQQLDKLEVIQMPFGEVMSMIKGTGMACRVVLDPHNLEHKTDVCLTFNKAATCARLRADFESSVAEPPK